ncbi:MAG: exodeoxyribonuclease V subunit alpha [Solirubrobacteraceae bacterium]
MSAFAVGDPFLPSLARRAPSPLREFNAAGVLSAADVHVALRLAGLAGAGEDPHVLLAAALAVRAPRLGHVFVDLSSVAQTAIAQSSEDLDLSALPWPAVQRWVARVAACRELVADGDGSEPAGGTVSPLRLVGARLYLDRYWREERMVAFELLSLGCAPLRRVDVALLGDGIARLFSGDDDQLQRVAAACAVLRRLAVLAGGPGTGKTTTVARIVALICEQALAAGEPPPLVALAAPTGKAAAGLQQTVHDEARALRVEEDVRASLLALRASTIHRLLAYRPGSHSRFRHDRSNRLPHDAVIVDESSMVSLSLMARLLEAVRPDARLVLVGDHEQLPAIEAGAVLRDIVGPATVSPRISHPTRSILARALSCELDAEPIAGSGAFGDGIVVLDRVHRFGAGIAGVASAIRAGDPDAVLVALREAGAEVTWIQRPAGSGGAAGEALSSSALAPLRDVAVRSGRVMIEAARTGDAGSALAALGSFRLLCAQRHGPHGIAVWTAAIERWLAQAVPGFDPDAADYAGRPLLITHNDFQLRLYNGDTGVVVASGPERLAAAFERNGERVTLATSRLASVETVYAMTIHKSQGSQFDVTAVVVGDASSRILTRELLYTAVTRARRRLILVAAEDAVRAAVTRRVARATGLRERLWGPGMD